MEPDCDGIASLIRVLKAGRMVWQGEEEHEQLLAVSTSLVRALFSIPNRLQHGEVQHYHHTHLAVRCSSLAVYIDSAIRDAMQDAYAAAFGSLRSSLEHMFIDKLVFLGQRYVQVFRDIDDNTWSEWQRLRDSGEGWIDVTEWRRGKGNTVHVTRDGIHYESTASGDRQTIGVHYFLLDEYSPFVGSQTVQKYFDDGLSEVSDREAVAKHHNNIYQTYLKWQSVKSSLKANDFADDEQLRRLDVHYRFLGAFVHPNTDVSRLLYGRSASNWPVYDHYSSELILLYAIVLAVEELRSFHAMTLRQPSVGISEWDQTEQLCEQAWSLASHLWFLGHAPHEYDRIQEANRRTFRELRTNGQRTSVNPAALNADEISYYTQPLERLVKMHSSSQEIMTGRAYSSPWPRTDALYR